MHLFVRLAPLAILTAALHAQGCLDQSYVPSPFNNGLEITSNQDVTQTFTVGRSGVLAQLDLAGVNHHRGISVNTLDVALVTTDSAGTPTTNVLGQVVLQPASIPTTTGVVSIDLSAFNIAVTAGQVLGIWAQSQSPPGGSTYAWWGEAPGTYAAGDTYIRVTTKTGFDLAFQTFLASTPSQSSYGTGFPGRNGIPTLTASAPPQLGTTIQLQVSNSAGTNTRGALFIGTAQASVPTPFGGTLLVAILADIPLTIPAAGLALPVALPFDPSACGLSLHLQAVELDSGAALGVSFTAGRTLTLGL